MKDTEALFRLLIVGGFAIGLAGALIDLLIPALVPETLKTALESLDEEWSVPRIVATGVLCMGGLVVGVASTVGLYLFKPWSRRLALVVTILGFSGYFLFGPTVQSALSTMLIDASMMIWGGVLAMAYYSDLGGRFKP